MQIEQIKFGFLSENPFNLLLLKKIGEKGKLSL